MNAYGYTTSAILLPFTVAALTLAWLYSKATGHRVHLHHPTTKPIIKAQHITIKAHPTPATLGWARLTSAGHTRKVGVWVRLCHHGWLIHAPRLELNTNS